MVDNRPFDSKIPGKCYCINERYTEVIKAINAIMSRPKANPDQHMRAYSLWLSSRGPSEIFGSLVEEFEKPVSERTVNNWIKEFKALNPKTVSLDAPFEWHRMAAFQEYGPSWEASDFIMEMLEMVHGFNEGLANIQGEVLRFRPTFREVIWWWRVSQAAPEIATEVGILFDIYWLASTFVFRELSQVLLGVPLEAADVEACLALKPWLDKEHHEKYHRAVKIGIVPPVRSVSRELSIALSVASGSMPKGWLAGGVTNPREHAELLYSQQFLNSMSNPEEFVIVFAKEWFT